MLDAVSELPEYSIRNVGWVLCDEVNANALASNKSNNLFYLVCQCLRRIRKQRVRLVKEKDELWQRQVADFRQPCINVAEQPEQEA